MLSNKDFYDNFAEDYGKMISFDNAIEKRKSLLSNIVLPKVKYAADLGCGTGIDSAALAQLSLAVTGFDPSGEMIKQAKNNAGNTNLEIDFANHGISEIPAAFNKKFELVISLGNTFANIERDSFQSSIKKCHDLLKEQGSLFIQVLNYKMILKEKKRIVNITESDEHFFIRFYDFIKDEIKFNILKFSKAEPKENNLITTTIHPYAAKDFNNSLLEAGFKSVNIFSDLNRNEFDENSSKDLFIKAAKN
jgi:SAM-dependent methyltransferase